MMAEMKRENEKLPAGEAGASSELFLGMISLRTCPERRAFFERGWKEQARKFLPATASEAERQDPSFLGAKMYYHVADLDPEGGVLGCTRSHMALYQKAIDSTNAKAAIVFEDDVKVNGHFTPSVIRDCLALMDTWDVVRFHKTGICKIHGCLSDNLFHSSNLCGRAYMISRPLMEYVLRFDSKEVVPYTYFLPKASARQLTYHPSLITEGAFGSWNTKGFGRAAGAKQDDDTSCLAPAASSRTTSSSASSGSSSCSSVKTTTTTPSSGPAAKKPRPGPEVAKQDAGGSADKKFSALAFLQWSLKYTTAIEQTVANVHFFTNLPSPLFNDTTFPRAETFWSKCREEHDAGNRFSRVQTFAEYRQRIGRYDSAVKGVCPRRLSAEGVHYFGYVKSLRRLLFGAETEYAESKDVTEKSVPRGNDDDAVTHLRAVERLQLARREERTGLGFGYEMVAGAGSSGAKLFHPGPPSKRSSCVEIAAPVKHAQLQQPTTDFDVIVVGAGIAGSSCAWTFANAGAKVLLVEQWDVLNENKRRLSPIPGTSSNIKTGKDHHKDNDYFESMGSSRGGPRRIGTLDLAPGTRVREAWTAWCDMKAMAEELAASSSSSKKSAARRDPPLLDVIGEVLVVDIFPFGWLLLVFFLIWWLCRRIFAGADSLPRGLELLWNREQLLSKLPKDAFRFRSANVFGIYYADAAALYTKEILQYFHAAAVPARQLDEMVASSSSSEDHDGADAEVEATATTSRPSSTQTPSDYSILGKTKVVNVRRESNAAVVVDCVENIAAASFDAGNAGNGMRDAKPTALRAKHVVIAGGGWTGELLKKMGFENARTKIGVFTCPSYDVNVVAKEGRSSCTQKPSPAKGGKRKDAVAPQVGSQLYPPLSVENKCPLFAFPAARIYGFPMACGHDGHQVMSIRPNYPSTWCQDPENHTKFDEHLHVVDSFLTEYVRPDALVPSAASPKSPNKTLPPRPTPTAASPSRKSAPGKPHHQPLNHAPLNSYTCRYPQLAVDGKKFGAVMDFVPGYDNRVVLAAGFDGYGFKYGSLYGKEVLDLLVTHRRVSGLEWEKKPAENLLLRWLHAIIDLLLKAAGGDEGDADEETTSRFPLHFGFVVLAACWAYLVASSVLFGSTLSGLFTTLFVLNVAYTLGSEWFYRTPKTFSDWQRVGVIWGVHYAWALGAPVAVSAFVSHLLCAPPRVAGGGSDTGLRQAPSLLLLACLLTLGGIYLRYRSMDECDHYDRSARGLQLGDDEFKLGVGDQKLCGKEQTGKRASSSKNKKPAAPGSSGKKKSAPSSLELPSSAPEDGSQTSFARQDRVVTMTGIYSYCRHPGFAAHILHATAVAMAVVVFFRVYGSAGTSSSPVGAESSSSPALSETGLLTAARAVFTQAAALQEFLRGLLWSVVIPLVHFQVAYVIFVMSANDEEKEFLEQEDFREAYLHYQVVVPTQFNFMTKLLEPVGEAIRGVRCGGNNERRVFLRLLGLIQGTPVGFLDPVEEPELIEKVLEGSNKGHFIEDLIACPAWQPVRSVESVQYHEAMRMKESLSHVFARTRVFDRIDSIIDECVARDPCLSRNSALPNMAKSNSTCTTVDCSDSERNLSMSQQISLVSTDSPSMVPSRDHSIVGSQTGSSDDGEKIVSEPEDGGGNAGNSCSTGSTSAGSCQGEVGPGLTRQESSVGGTASTSSSRPRTSSTGHAFSPPARGSRGSECKGGSASSTASSPKKGVAALPKKGSAATSASEDGGPIAGCADVTRHSFEIFFKVLTDRFPTESESRMAHAAVDEWRKMIAMKGQADSEKKVEFVDFMRRSLKESPFFQSNAPREESNYTNANENDHHAADEEASTSVAPAPKQVVKRTTSEKMADEYVFNWDDMNCLSCVLQPMIISPMINFADVFTSMKTILDRHPHWREEIVAPTKFSETPAGIVPSPNVGAQLGLKERTRSEEVADKVILEGMRCAHPFPILERTVTRDVERNGETRFKKGTQVFIEYDQYCQGEKESSCPFLSGKMEGPGSGEVSCPFMTGQQSGKAAGTSDEKTATASPPSVFDPNRWHDEQKCVYRAVPFGSGVRRCFGQKVARVILRKLLVAYCRNWDRFEPSTGHAFSGRNNDSDPGDTFYVAKNLVRCLADGVKYRFGLSM